MGLFKKPGKPDEFGITITLKRQPKVAPDVIIKPDSFNQREILANRSKKKEEPEEDRFLQGSMLLKLPNLKPQLIKMNVGLEDQTNEELCSLVGQLGFKLSEALAERLLK